MQKDIFSAIRKFQRQNGFTLIEVMIAIGVIAIGMFALLTMLSITLKGNMQSKNVTEATTLAQSKIEELKNESYTNLAGYNGSVTVYYGTDTVTNTSTTRHYLYVTVATDSPGTDTSTITVDVYYNPGTPTSTHSVQLQAVIAQ